MDIARIQREFAEAQRHFAPSNCGPTTDGKVYAKTALQTGPDGNTSFPSGFPTITPTKCRAFTSTRLRSRNAPHRYQGGHICYLHPSMWNPGAHNLAFVIARAAKWLNKYEVWRSNGGKWPGAQIRH